MGAGRGIKNIRFERQPRDIRLDQMDVDGGSNDPVPVQISNKRSPEDAPVFSANVVFKTPSRPDACMAMN